MNHDVKVSKKEPSTQCSRWWMGYFLATIALIGFPLCVGACVPFFLLSYLWPRSQNFADAVMQWGISWLMRVQPWFSGEVDIEIPKSGGALIISNHRSHLDVFILLSRIKGVRVLARSSLFYIPFLGIMMKVSGQIPARRGRLDSFWKAMDKMRERLRAGEIVHVFPEMTRCAPGFQGLNNFTLAPFLIAKELRVPIVPMVIEGTDLVWPKGSFALRSKQPVRIRTLSHLDPASLPTAEELCRETRKLISERLA